MCAFYPSALWARRGIVVPFVHQHGATDWIHTNIQPLVAIFFTQGQGQSLKIQKKKWECDNLTTNYWISPIFHVKLPMSMEITWLDFQFSTDKQNLAIPGDHFFFSKFFFSNFWNLMIYVFEYASLLALSVFMWARKRGYGGHFCFINFDKSFSVSFKCLETWDI